ncbi:Uncharacterised protein [Actinomyces denticolens]|nr:Uncharacterised protein [Actinomyces denticolens]
MLPKRNPVFMHLRSEERDEDDGGAALVAVGNTILLR